MCVWKAALAAPTQTWLFRGLGNEGRSQKNKSIMRKTERAKRESKGSSARSRHQSCAREHPCRRVFMLALSSSRKQVDTFHLRMQEGQRGHPPPPPAGATRTHQREPPAPPSPPFITAGCHAQTEIGSPPGRGGDGRSSPSSPSSLSSVVTAAGKSEPSNCQMLLCSFAADGERLRLAGGSVCLKLPNTQF